jgi:PEP-CTERM motif-containing protein
MKISRILTALLFTTLFMVGSRSLRAQANGPFVILNEDGQGTLQFPGNPLSPLPSAPAQDPGPGGLPNALTYDLGGPPRLIAGDVFLFELGVSDIIRFNPAGTGGNPGYPASAVFYSDNTFPSQNELADTGFPTAIYTNTVVIMENTSGATIYTPTSTQPGFVPGFSVTYNFFSPIPEPSTWAMIGAGVGVLLGVQRLLRKRG